MKPLKYTLNINKPCSQDWVSMENTALGKFCDYCSKNVVDFTNMSDAEINRIILQSPGKICGRLKTQQLNRTIHTTPTKNHSRIYDALVGILLLLTSKNIFATGKMVSSLEIVSTNNENFILPTIKNTDVPVSDTLKNTITGVVIDETTGDPLSFASVFLKGSEISAITDVEGQFTITVPQHLLTDTILIEVKYIGYQNSTQIITKASLPIVKKIIVCPTERYFKGDVVIVTEKKKWWQFKRNRH